MLQSIRTVLRNRRGQSLVEYGILVGAVALVCLIGATMLGHKVSNLFAASSALLPAVEAEDAGPVFSGKLVQVTQQGGAMHLSSIPGTFSTNLGINGAEGLVVDE